MHRDGDKHMETNKEIAREKGRYIEGADRKSQRQTHTQGDGESERGR